MYGVPIVVSLPSSTSKTLSKEILSPFLYSTSFAFIFSIETKLPLETLYCLPPVCITANSSLFTVFILGLYYTIFYKKASLCYTITMQTKVIERYFFFGLLVSTFIFTFFIFRPFWIVLVLGLSFAIVLYPVYEWFKRRRLPNWLSSFLTVLFFVVVLCGPLLGIGAIVFNQSQDVYHKVTNNGNAGPFLDSIETKV